MFEFETYSMQERDKTTAKIDVLSVLNLDKTKKYPKKLVKIFSSGRRRVFKVMEMRVVIFLQ